MDLEVLFNVTREEFRSWFNSVWGSGFGRWQRGLQCLLGWGQGRLGVQKVLHVRVVIEFKSVDKDLIVRLVQLLEAAFEFWNDRLPGRRRRRSVRIPEVTVGRQIQLIRRGRSQRKQKHVGTKLHGLKSEFTVT